MKHFRLPQSITYKGLAEFFPSHRACVNWSIRTLLGLISPLCLVAKPVGLEIQSGKATCSSSHSNTFQINNSHNAILHWEDFSIAQGEKVQFIQPSSQSTVLNRVTGSNASQLLGVLKSNGTVFLINPNGVYIGGSAHIQTAGFLASTADITNEHFLKGEEMLFSSPGSGEVINQGHIECPRGDIFLIAKTVRNEGVLSADHVGLASSQEVLIRPEGNHRVVVRLDMEEGQVENSGTIQALAVELKTTSPYEKAIQQDGYIEVLSVKEENGRIYLSAENGRTFVNGSLIAESGEVHVLGKKIFLTENAAIDVSGPKGGTALIGGDYQGKNPDIPNAHWVTMDKGATIAASGTAGDGGKVILWGDRGMLFHGEVSAQAFGARGDGGFVEISSPGAYVYQGKVNTLSVHGLAGTLLLDPVNITINTAGPTNPALAPGPITYTPTFDATIEDGILASSLSTGNVTLNTSGGNTGIGTVTFNGNTSVTWSQNTTLTVNADRNILINPNATISNTGSGSIVLSANSAGAATGTFIGIDIDGGTLSTASGNITLTGKGGDTGGSNIGVVLRSAGSITSGDGLINLTGTSTGPGSSNYGVLVVLGGTVTSTGTASITLNGTGSTVGSTGGEGLRIQSVGSAVTSNSGNINFTGVGGNAGSSNIGIHLVDQAVVSSTSGTVTLLGTGGAGTSSNTGIVLLNSSIETSGTAAINLTGQGNGTGTGNVGIDFQPGGMIQTTGAGTGGSVTLLGTGGNGTNQNPGIHIKGASGIDWVDGPVGVTGNGGGTGTGNQGVYMNLGGSISSTGQASLTINGNGSMNSTSSFNAGIEVEVAPSSINSVNSAIQVTGQGGSGSFFNQGILIWNGGAVTGTGSAPITMTGTATGSGPNDHGIEINGLAVGANVTSSGGPITMNGTAAAPNAGIFMNITSSITSTGGPIFMNATPDLIVQNNSSVVVQGNNNVTINTEQDLNIVGANANNTPAFVSLQNGTGTFNVGRDLNVTSGTGTGSEAQMGNHGGFVGSASGSLNFSVGRDVNISSIGIDSFAIIGHGDLSTTQTLSGNINFMSVGRDINIAGAGAGAIAQGFAQIGHVNATGVGPTLSGNISMTADRDININGGTAVATAYARIGHGGQVGAATFLTSTMLLKAGGDFNMTSAVAEAQVVNSNGNLTVVVDNQFPIFPGIGGGGFHLNSLLFATGELRIYTARRSQNTINDLINGVSFAPGIFAADSAVEQWSIYFAEGLYGGGLFKIYYKEPIVITLPSEVAGSSLADLLPPLRNYRLEINVPSYHFQICEEWEGKRRECSPVFSPYGSFIFEDDLYWIGREF